MDFGTGVREIVGIHFAQQHRAFDPLGLRQLRGFPFGELKQCPTHAASLRVTIAPPPVLDELLSALHALVIDHAGAYLRRGGRDAANFLANFRAMPGRCWPLCVMATVPARVTAELLGQGAFCVACHRRVENIWGRRATHTPSNGWCSTTCPVKGLAFSEGPALFHLKSARRTRRRSCGSASSR